MRLHTFDDIRRAVPGSAVDRATRYQRQRWLTLIEERLNAANIGFVKITGQVRDQGGAVERFRTGEVPLFLISLKAGTGW
ncbi:MAG: hypothetical protein MUD06_15825 [Rhodospirillales bacterium]|jgi:SNF2 family DNA or RNA helicase|nr:hypothetical protein [Rhodospirillales bacterium]